MCGTDFDTTIYTTLNIILIRTHAWYFTRIITRSTTRSTTPSTTLSTILSTTSSVASNRKCSILNLKRLWQMIPVFLKKFLIHQSIWITITMMSLSWISLCLITFNNWFSLNLTVDHFTHFNLTSDNKIDLLIFDKIGKLIVEWQFMNYLIL